MKISELYDFLSERIPSSLSAEWDNDGLMLLADDREVEKVLLTLDCTDEAAEYATQNGFDLIVTHHPLIFRPLKGITDPLHIKLIKNGISVFSFHTRLDAVEGGVNDALCEICGAKPIGRNVTENIGVIGQLPFERTAQSFAREVKTRLGSPSVQLADGGRRCGTVAFVGGSGGFEAVCGALSAGADTLVTGECGYNSMLDGSRAGLNIITAGHFHTENPVLPVLEKLLRSSGNCRTERFMCLKPESL